MTDSAGQTTGDRLYLIRLACGDDFRKPEPIPLFVARVKRVTGAEYHEGTVSLLERMKQKWRVEDAEAFARVDPKKRGERWLAFGEEQQQATEKPSGLSLTYGVDPSAIEAEKRTAKAAKKKAGGKKRSG